MAKLKLRFREEILLALRQAKGPIPLKNLLKTIFHDARNAKLESTVARELRYLIKMKEVEKGSGNLFRIRPPKTKKDEARRTEAKFESREEREERKTVLKRHVVVERPKKAQREKPRGTVVQGKVIKNSRGFAFVAPINPPPFLKEDVFLNPEEADELLTGDLVEVALYPDRSDKGFSGRLIKVLERGIQKIVARYIKGTSYSPNMAEVDTKDLQIQIVLENDPTFKDLADGSAVVVEITESPKSGNPARGKILHFLADTLNSTTDDPHVILKHKLRDTFPTDVMEEVAKIPNTLNESDIKGREDLRALPFVTIDGADARDFDDAVCAKKMPNGTYRLWVAVADVAHYVKPGTALDKEAYERGTSVYFPHRVLPMLPEKLSNGLCSLNPNEDRLAMVAEIDYDPSAKKIKHRVLEGVFRSQHRCVYETLQLFYDRPQENGHDYNPRVKENLLALFELYKKVSATRTKRGSVDLNLPEAKVKVDKKTGEVETILRTERLDTHRLIEEFMIAANETVSEIMEQNKQAFIYRVHEVPEEEATKKFLDVARSLHVDINDKWIDEISPQTYQKMVSAISDSPSARVLNFLLLRSMKQAYYTVENLQHFGLASGAYSHFTSPIRRYPDLMVHRLLKAWLHKNKKESSQAKGSVAQTLEEAAQHCSMRERVAVDAERELIRIKQVRYAERHLGEEHSGLVVGINAKGAFVELIDVFIEGFVPIERFGTDYSFNDKLYHLRGKRTGKIIQMGDRIDVQIVRTTPHLLQVELEPLTSKAKKSKPDPKKEIQAPRDYWTLEDFN